MVDKAIELTTLSEASDGNEKSPSVTIDEFDDDTEKLLLSPSPTTMQQSRIGLCEFFCAYISLFLINKPRQSALIVSTLLIAFAITVNLTLENDKQVFNLDDVIEIDYSNVRSKYELNMGKIDHWCLLGGDQNCKCEDPTESISKMKYKFWRQTHELNVGLIDSFLGKLETEVDVVFLGENIVESWAGRSIGMETQTMQPIGNLFTSFFDKEDSGGKYNGLPLGIAGDTAPNVLWRIQNGELPDYLNPKVFWLVIGTNDLAIKQCSEEVVLLGILRVIEEIQSLRPDAKIIVNSIIPMTDDAKGRVPDITGQGSGGQHQHARILPRKPNDDKDSNDDDEDNDGDEKVEEASAEEEIKEEEKIEKIVNLRTMSPETLRLPINKIPTISIREPFKRIPVSMWPSVVAINAQLQRFCRKHKHVIYFDSYDVFVDRDTENNIPMLKKNYYKSFYTGMPSKEGNKALLTAMSGKLKNVMKRDV